MLNKICSILLIFGLFGPLYALDFNSMAKSALKEKKLILLSVESDNCRYCEKMNKETFTPKENILKIQSRYVQKIVIEENTDLPANFDVKYYPTNFILNPKDMSIIDEFVGYMKADDFLSLLDVVYEEEAKN